MAYADQQMSGSKMVAIALVALIHIALAYALVTGLAYSAVTKMIDKVTTVDITEPPPPEEEPPPPEPQPETPPPPVAPPPPISIAVTPPKIVTQVTIPPPAPPRLIVPPPAPPAPPPAPPAPSQARGVQADGQSRWAARIQENYPAAAVRREIEGSVGVTVQIGTDGRVSSCSVTKSSGESSLDQAACQGMERYARYKPALNAGGQPIAASTSTTIVYRLGK